MVVCLGLAAGLTPTPAKAGGKGAILFGAGVLTGVIINEAVKNHHRNHPPRRAAPPPRRYYPVRPRARVNTSVYSRSEAMEIQRALNTLGYNAGTVDGVIGRGTKAAIATFQIEIDEKPTGVLTQKQKIILLDRAQVAENSSDDDNQLAARPSSKTQARYNDDDNQRNRKARYEDDDDDDDVRRNNSPRRQQQSSDYDWTKVQKALNVLGYPAGDETGELTDDTLEAIKAFQIDIAHEATGVLTAEEQGILFEDAGDLAVNDDDDDDDDDNDNVVQINQVQDNNRRNDDVALLGSNSNNQQPAPSTTGLTDNLALNEYRIVSQMTDPVEQLKAVRNALNSPPRFVGGLSATEKLARESQLTQLEADIKKELLTPIVERADSAPVSLAGVRQIAALQGSAEPVFSVLGPNESQAYRERLQARQDKILGALLSDQVAELKSYPQSLQGLKQSALWYDRFMGDYSDFSGNGSVADALKTFEQDRIARLTAMFPEFEKEVAAASDPIQQAPRLVQDYLSWQGDDALPISLEYKFVAAQYQ